MPGTAPHSNAHAGHRQVQSSALGVPASTVRRRALDSTTGCGCSTGARQTGRSVCDKVLLPPTLSYTSWLPLPRRVSAFCHSLGRPRQLEGVVAATAAAMGASRVPRGRRARARSPHRLRPRALPKRGSRRRRVRGLRAPSAVLRVLWRTAARGVLRKARPVMHIRQSKATNVGMSQRVYIIGKTCL